MDSVESHAHTLFQFGQMKVEILQGDILKPGVPVDAVVSTDDNYMTMGSGVAKLLMQKAGTIEYVREAQQDCPVLAGSVVVTRSYGLKDLLRVDYVLHGAVIDYDTDVTSLPDLVEQTTNNCLEQAEALGVHSILFPAFATGSGGLSMTTCARRMCNAIKVYVGRDRPVNNIYIMLYRPDGVGASSWSAALNDCFIREANLVLGVPYEPTRHWRQVRDFYGGEVALQKLEEIITGKSDAEGAKRHAVILGGPLTGKWALLDHLCHHAQQPDSPLSKVRLVKVTFGRVHENTPASFVYRKFLCALRNAEQDTALVQEIKETYSDPGLDRERFVAFLDKHKDHYGEVVLLIDKLPRLLRMEAKNGESLKGVQAFWKDLDKLGTRVRFVYTATPAEYQQLRKQRLEPHATAFLSRIEEIVLACVTDQDRRKWVNELFSRYLGYSDDAPEIVHGFFEDEAGRHPYLISLYGYALVEALKRDMLTNPRHPAKYTKNSIARFFQAARNATDEPRRAFFEMLLDVAKADERRNLKYLAQAVVVEEKERRLMPGLDRKDPKAQKQWQELQAQGNPRELLDDETLLRLEQRGYVVNAGGKAQFMARSFATWVGEYFGVRRRRAKEGQPSDVEISLLHVTDAQGNQSIRTMFHGRGARITTAQTELHPELKREFMKSFSQCLNHLLHPLKYPQAGPWPYPQEVGEFILSQFATNEINSHLQDPPHGCTVSFEIDEALKDIPWELMLETDDEEEIPFRVGRRIIGQQPANVRPAGSGAGKIKALLIGDPVGDLAAAQEEVTELAERLRNESCFEEPHVLLGPAQCKLVPILQALSSKQYGLIHYSGHTKFDGYRSAWQLAEGAVITTDELTKALRMKPPAFVFSSSCQSAVAGEPQPIQYENQTFDLPSAFLQAGVEAYIGTLWEVESEAALHFVEDFYDAFLCGKSNLGECLRQAKWARKQAEGHADKINWLSFILYGDPHLMPGDLFPVMGNA